MHCFRKLSVLQFRSISHSLISVNCSGKRFLCSAKETNENERTASFGFQTVPESEKADKGIYSERKKSHTENRTELIE